MHGVCVSPTIITAYIPLQDGPLPAPPRRRLLSAVVVPEGDEGERLRREGEEQVRPGGVMHSWCWV